MGLYTSTYTFSNGTTADGGQVETEKSALGASVNDITNAQINSSAAIGIAKIADSSAYAAYVPTWTNLTIANAVVVARYIKIGKLVHAWGSAIWGSGTSASGSVSMSLPVTTNASYNADNPIGQANNYDASTTAQYIGFVNWASSTTAYIKVMITNDTYGTPAVISNAVPFTWTTSDYVNWSLAYEAA